VSNLNFVASVSPVYIPLVARALPLCDDVEPNDVNTDAKTLTTIGTTCAGSLENEPVGADDWYKFSLAQGKRVTIDLSGIPAGADYQLVLYRDPPSTRTQVGQSVNSGNASEHIEYTASSTAIYKLRIYKKVSAQGTDAYLLRVVVN
jgi:hypothetical protein